MIKTYIVTWKNVSDRIESLTSQIPNHIVINSDAEPRDEWVNLGMVWYYNQIKYAINDFLKNDEEIFCWITGDISSSQMNMIYQKAANIMNEDKSIFLYAPNFTNEAWNMDACKIKDRDSFTYYACQTDGIMFFMRRDLVQIFSEYMDKLSKENDLSSMQSGWGLDYVWSVLAIYMNKNIVRDTEFIVTHPQGSSYDHGKANADMIKIRETFFDFAHFKNMDMAKIQIIWGAISGRMAHDPKYMSYENFYTVKNNLKYTVISINNSRVENIDRIKSLIGQEEYVDIKFLNAIDDDERRKFIEKYPEVKPYHNYKLGEFGCFGSHYIIWKYLLESDMDQIIVFEDDAFVEDTIVESIKTFMENLPKDYDVFSVYVDANQYDRYREIEHKINNFISKGYQDWSTLCYIVSRKGAQKLIDRVKEYGMDAPVDWFIFRNGDAGLFDVYTLPPSIKSPVRINDITGSMVQYTNFLDGTQNK